MGLGLGSLGKYTLGLGLRPRYVPVRVRVSIRGAIIGPKNGSCALFTSFRNVPVRVRIKTGLRLGLGIGLDTRKVPVRVRIRA